MSTKSFKEYNLRPIEEPGMNITLEDFDRFEGDYKFSETYQNNKQTLLDSMSDKPRTYLFQGNTLKIAAAFALVCIVFPTTSLAAIRMYQTHIEKEHYQSDVVVTPNTETTTETGSDTTENSVTPTNLTPVKMTLTYLPEGSEPIMEGDEKTYVPTDSDANAHGVSPWLFALDVETDMIFSESDTIDTYEFTASGNPAYLLQKSEAYAFDKIIYVMFEEQHYIAKVNLGYAISIEEAKKIASGITLEETDETNASAYTSYAEWMKDQAEWTVQEENEAIAPLPNTYHSVGDALPSDHMNPDCVMTVKNVEFYDSVANFNRAYFYDSCGNGEIANIDATGNILSYDREKWNYGDGVNSIDELVEVQNIGRKFVYLTLEITNQSDTTATDYCVYNQLYYLTESANGKLDFVDTDIYISNHNAAINVEPVYFDASPVENTNSHYFYLNIPAGETVTCHVGYFVDEDLTDTIFLMTYDDTESYGLSSSSYCLTDIREKQSLQK